MLSKNKIEKKLQNYIREHLHNGYSKRAITKVLAEHGYDESYVGKLLKKHYETQFVKKYALFVSLIFVISIFSFNLISTRQQSFTGYAASIGNSDEGCCASICQQTSKDECYGRFIENRKCEETEECRVGCCIDQEGYCLTNYLYGNCISGKGININRDCNDLVFCRNITGTSYLSRLYSIKGKKDAGTLKLEPSADYYRSSFNIRYYLYDKTDVLSVAAEIRDASQLIDTITLYDDGHHNDGAENDNLYANNWLSSRLGYFEGFKQLNVGIIVKFKDGTQQAQGKNQTIVLLSKNKCLPIYNDWSSSAGKPSIIFAANNYESLEDGYPRFQGDVKNFLDILFSIKKFSDKKDDFNIYRFEQSLSYDGTAALTSLVSRSCPSYSAGKDEIIVLDNNEDYCVKESMHVIRINPRVLFYKNISSAEMGNVLDDFCNYALTPKKLADQIVSFSTPPTITVYTLGNITYNTTNANLSFGIYSANYPVNYSVFLENSTAANGMINYDMNSSIILNLINGSNAVLIQAIDKNRNMAFSELLLNATMH